YFSTFIFKYLLILIFFSLAGRSFLILINGLNKKNILPKTILLTRRGIIYPIIGFAIVGNLLVFLNIFLPLKSHWVVLILFTFISINLFSIDINVKQYLNLQNFLYYVVIPSVFIVSTFNISFHYDAGFYHLNNQNWLRESNMIFGFVNIFWAFGMSSIYEYISSIFWIEDNFVSLHFLNLIFINFFYIFLIDNAVRSKNINLKNASIFVIIFSLFDNFGYGGGRNGFIYIEGIAKQDIVTAILFVFISVIGLITLKDNIKLTNIDLSVFSLLLLFTIQIKLNAVILGILYLAVIYKQIKAKNKVSFLISSQAFTLFFGVVWIFKNFITTGCLIFPLSISCNNNFDWYEIGSSEVFESISKGSSLNYDLGTSFYIWFQNYVEYDFYVEVIKNYTISMIVLIVIKKTFFKTIKIDTFTKSFTIFYIICNIVYLITFGPIPRYAVGIMVTTVALVGILSGEAKFNIDKRLIYFPVLISVMLLVRQDSYQSILSNEGLILFDPRPIAQYIEFNENWVIPDEGDQCWVNLECTMNKDDIQIIQRQNFKIAYKY
ncbi:hypothetical protein N9N01_02370, partial [Candidatus Actinomarina sp.]|nr:hypothetical protein [Candidatus Actinomarina sp.]